MKISKNICSLEQGKNCNLSINRKKKGYRRNNINYMIIVPKKNLKFI